VKKFIYILLCSILSACASMALPPVMPTALQPFDSGTPEITPQIISTFTIAPTTAIEPSSTPSPTEIVQADPTEQAYKSQATKAAEFSVACDSSDQEKFISPNGIWLAIHCIRKIDPTLEIVNLEGNKHWIFKLRDYVSVVHEEGAGPGGFHPEHWSNDGKYLYFTSALYSSGGYVCYYDDRESQGLYRLKLNDGSVSTVLPPVTSYNDITFSPTGRRFAYGGNGDLIVLDLQTSSELKISSGETFGNLIWSTDGLELVYATCKSNAYDDSILEKSAVKIFSIQKQESSTILEMEKNILYIKAWDENNILTILSQDQNYHGSTLFFDLNSGQWITPIPKP
jgi:WD40 repeat protein